MQQYLKLKKKNIYIIKILTFFRLLSGFHNIITLKLLKYHIWLVFDELVFFQS